MGIAGREERSRNPLEKTLEEEKKKSASAKARNRNLLFSEGRHGR